MDFPKKQQQSLIPRYLLQYLQDLQISHNDPTAPWGGGGGGTYTAGTGIDITNSEISIDQDIVATKNELNGYIEDNDLNYSATFRGKGVYVKGEGAYTTTSYGDGAIARSIPRQPGYTYNLPSASGTLALTSDIPSLTNYVTTDTYQVITGQKQINTAFNFGDGDHNNIMIDADYVNRPLIAMINDTTGVEFNIGVDDSGTETPVNGAYFSHTNDNGERYYTLPHQDATGLSTYILATTDDIPTKTSDLTNDSGFITSSALTGYATETWVTNQGYSTFSGSYNDLTNKPTIPTSTSDLTNDSGFITSSALTNYVTTNTSQTIYGSKTFTNTVTFSGSNSTTGRFAFTGRNPIKMTAPNNSTTGFTLFDWYNSEKGYLQYNSTQDALYLGRWGNASSPKYAQNIGFLSELDSYGYRVLMPNKTGVTGAATLTANTYYIPTEITNGTTVVKASSDGIIDISSLISGGGTTVSGTNDGTNWTSLTIGSDTYGIPSGGGGGGSYSAGTGIDITNNTIAIDSTVVALKSDIPSLTGYATQAWVRNQGYSKANGSYSGNYWTSITINGTKKYIPSGEPTNMVTTDTDQDITGAKTFVGKQKLNFKQSFLSSSDTLGFTAYDYTNNEIGNLQIANRTVGGNSNMYVTLGNWSSQSTKSKVGFRLQPNSSSNSYNFVMPYGTNSDFTSNGYSTSSDTTIPCAFTDGTTIVKADATGLVNISSISGGSGGSSMSNYIIRFIGNGSGTNCDVSIRCTLKDNSTLVPGIYTTFVDTDMALIDYLDAALVGITTYDYVSREFAIFTEFYFADTTTLEYDGFEIAEIKISKLAY